MYLIIRTLKNMYTSFKNLFVPKFSSRVSYYIFIEQPTQSRKNVKITIYYKIYEHYAQEKYNPYLFHKVITLNRTSIKLIFTQLTRLKKSKKLKYIILNLLADVGILNDNEIFKMIIPKDMVSPLFDFFVKIYDYIDTEQPFGPRDYHFMEYINKVTFNEHQKLLNLFAGER